MIADVSGGGGTVMRKWRLRTAWVLAALGAVAAPAQEPPRFGTGVDLVYVTVAAHDKKGHAVADLTPADLVVKEDGKVRPVTVLVKAADAPLEQTAIDGCVVIDTSGSVAATTEELTTSALRVMAQMPRLRRSCLLSFDNDVRIWHTDADPAVLARDIVAARAVNGATALNTALVTAVKQLGDGPGRAVIMLMSDGDDVGSRVTQAEALAEVQGSRATVYAFTHAAPVSMSLSPGAGVGNRPLAGGNTGVASWNAAARFSGPAYLSRLAETTGGRVFGPGDGSVAEAFERLSREVAGQYVLGFAPASGYPGLHKLKLETKRKDLRLRYRPSFVMRSEQVPAP
jgi:VWFA-related protein